MSVTIKHPDVGKLVKKITAQTAGATGRGIIRGAVRSRAVLQRNTPVDQGQLKASWRTNRSYMTTGARTIKQGENELATNHNDAPHAGIVEHGSRPHGMSPSGWAAIYKWVERHKSSFLVGRNFMGPITRLQTRRSRPRRGEIGDYNGPDPDITNAIVQKIAREGTPATFFVRDSLPEIVGIVNHEVDALVRETLAKGAAK